MVYVYCMYIESDATSAAARSGTDGQTVIVIGASNGTVCMLDISKLLARAPVITQVWF